MLAHFFGRTDIELNAELWRLRLYRRLPERSIASTSPHSFMHPSYFLSTTIHTRIVPSAVSLTFHIHTFSTLVLMSLPGLKGANRHSLHFHEQQLRLKQLCKYSLDSVSNDDSNGKNGRNHRHRGAATRPAAGVGSLEASDSSITEGQSDSDDFDEDHPTFHVGDHVDADWRRMGELYPAVVVNVSEDGNLITVRYDEDGIVETLHRMYLMLIAKAGTTPPPPAARPKPANGVGGAKEIEPKWLEMLDRLCEYQEVNGTSRVSRDDDPELFKWWQKTQKDYIERSKRRSSGIGGLQVSMLEERAGWQYHRGSLVFPDSSVPKKKKRKLKQTKQPKGTSIPPMPKDMITPVPQRAKSSATIVTPDKPREGNKKLFPFVCHEMIMKATEKLPHLVQWSSDGCAFYLLTKEGEGLEPTFFSFFRHKKFTSWQRQCYNYDIVKQRSGKYEGAYYNSAFRRDSKPSDIAKMHRIG